MTTELDAPLAAHRRTPATLLIVFGLAAASILLPAAPFVRFNGLPLSSIPEALALLLFVLVAVTPEARSGARSLFGRPGPVHRQVLIGVLAAACVVKVLLCCAAPAGEFRACASSRVTTTALGACEPSYENPWSRDSATRFTRTIDFGPLLGGTQFTPAFAAGTTWGDPNDPRLLSSSNWNFGFLNSVLLHGRYPPARPTFPDVERVPFAVRFEGAVTFDERSEVVVTYVGEGRIRVGGRVRSLPASYEHERLVRIAVPAGSGGLLLRYEFDDGFGTRHPERLGPIATLRVEEAARGGNGDRALLEADPAGLPWRVLGVIVDLAGLLIIVALFAIFVIGVRRYWRWYLAVGGLALAVAVVDRPIAGFGLPALPMVASALALCVLLVALLVRRPNGLLAVGVPAAVLVAGHQVLAVVADLDRVLYRPAGDDWLTYQAHAMNILETRSLQGGEPIFFYQPGFRYLVFGEHMLLGGEDALSAIAGLAALLGGVFFVLRHVALASRLSSAALAVVGAAGVGLVLLVTSAPVRDLVIAGASEYATWLLIPLGLFLLFDRSSLATWCFGAAALATATLMRPNQAIPTVLLMIVFLVAHVRVRRLAALGAAALFVAVLLLPAVHNAWYGEVVQFTPTGVSTVEDLPLDRLADVLEDSGVRDQLRGKAAAWTYLTPAFPRSDALGLATVVLAGAWLAALLRLPRRRQHWLDWVLMLWPLSFVAHSLVYDVFGYYPRHVVVLYVAFGAVCILVRGGSGLPPRMASRRDPDGSATSTGCLPVAASP